MTRRLVVVENLALAAALGALALLPIVEILLRATFHVGIPGAQSFAQHFALVAGMLGAAVAARESRLLSLSSLQHLLRGRALAFARFFTGVVALGVTALLLLASLQFVLAERAGGNLIALGVPVWLGEAVLPLGFSLIALRLAVNCARGWPARGAALLIALATAGAASGGVPLSNAWALALLAALLVATLLGSPIFTALVGAALVLFWVDGLPIASMALDNYRLVVNTSLPMIPLFALAGYLLAEGGAPRRLIRACNALFAGMRGGAAIVTVAACAFFTSFSGASGVTIIALGGMLMPLLRSAGYTEKAALGLLTGAGSVGGLLPPGLPLVIFAIVAKVSIEDMFLAGILPGLLMVGLIALWGVRQAGKPAERPAFDWPELRAALAEAKWELALPLVPLGALFSGFATAVEAAALTAVYAFAVQVFVHRDLDLRRDVPRVMAECGLLVGGILLILGVALGLTNYLVDARLPERAVDWGREAFDSRWTFLLALNAFLLVAGCFLDIFSATVVLVPLLLPLGAAFGVEPVHLGIVFLANMELGYLTPPVGMNLFFAAYRFGKPLGEVVRAALPPIVVLAVGVALVTFQPWLATAFVARSQP